MENGTTAARLIERRRRHLFGAHAEHLAQLGRCRLALVSGAITLVCAAVAWAATEAPRGSVVLWSGDDQWVKIEPQDDPAAVPNDHPAQLGVEAITNALGALQVRLVDPDTGTESHRPVFTPDELGNLTPHGGFGACKGRASTGRDVQHNRQSSTRRGGTDQEARRQRRPRFLQRRQTQRDLRRAAVQTTARRTSTVNVARISLRAGKDRGARPPSRS